MSTIRENFPSKQKEKEICYCGGNVSMEHIYLCNVLNGEKVQISYNQLFFLNIDEQIKVYKRFQNNFEIREKMKTQNDEENFPPRITTCEPQSSGIEYCNGFDK